MKIQSSEDDGDSEKTAEICWTCNTGERSGVGLSGGHNGRKTMEKLSKDEVHEESG